MCECGASLCDRRVPMPASDYDELDEPLLADGHQPPDGSLGDCPRCGRQRRERRRRR
jgi:hypothetical protein